MILLLSGGLIGGCNDSEGAVGLSEERSALLVNVAAADPGTGYTIRREYAGRVEAARASDVGFELGGELAGISVDDGDLVRAGDVLARLDTARLEARLAEAEAALAQAVSARDLAERTLERNRVAAEFEGISAQELDLAIDAANAARAAVSAAEARVRSVRVDIGKSRLTAPYDAVVVRRLLDEGRIVSPGQPVLALQDAGAPEVRIGVPGDLAERLGPGETRRLAIGERRVEATVRAVLPLRDPATRTVDVIFRLEPGADALPGDLARLALELPVAADGYRLPLGALAEGSRGLWQVYVAAPLNGAPAGSIGATHALEPRAVEIVHEGAADVFVRGALGPGELYVTGGLHRLVPGQLVRIADTDDLAMNGDGR